MLKNVWIWTQNPGEGYFVKEAYHQH